MKLSPRFSRFFRTVLESASKPESYKVRLTERFSRALGYLYWLLFCIMLISGVVLAGGYIFARSDVQEFSAKAGEELPTLYPENLVLTVSGGMLSTNVVEPYVIDPSFWREEEASFEEVFEGEGEDKPTHLITIDTDGSIDNYTEYDTVVLLTRTAAMFPNDNGLQVFLWKDVGEDFEIDKELYDEMMTAVMPFVAAIPFIADIVVVLGLTLWPFVGAGFLWMGYMIYLVVFTLFVWAIGAIMGRKLRYPQVWQISLFGLTLPILYSVLSGWFPVLYYPFVFSTIFLIWMIVVLHHVPRSGPAPLIPGTAVVAKPAKPRSPTRLRAGASPGREKPKADSGV